MTLDLDPDLSGSPIPLFHPDLLLPVQFFHPRPKATPEQNLMIAVLDDAIRCLEKYRVCTDRRGRRFFEEAKLWLLITEPEWPYSFERICAVLDLNADAVRESLLPASKRSHLAESCAMQASAFDCGERTE